MTRTLRILFLSSTALVSLAGAGLAADLPTYAPAPAPYIAPPPLMTWTGFYLGANGGWIGLDSKASDSDAFYDGSSHTIHPNGGVYGGQVGYNWQMGSIVYGLEGDFDGASASKSSAFPSSDPGASQSSKLDDLATVRGRLGFLIQPNVLIYATGGYAGGQVKNSIVDFTGSPTWSSSKWQSGYAAGGGVEWMFAPRWSFKAEAMYVSLNKSTVEGDTDSSRFKFSNNAAIARVGVNYHF